MSSIISASTTSATALNLTADTSGQLEIKTGSTPTTAVTIDTSQRAAFVAGTAALPAITTTGDTNTGIWFPAADTIAFAEGGAESMRLDSSGNLMLGTNSPVGSVSKQSISYSGAVNWGLGLNDTSSTNGMTYIMFQTGGANRGNITNNNNTAVAYNTTSDYRLKENVVPMVNALDTISKLKPVTYKWKQNGLDGQGFIAHELQAVVPDCVSGEKDAVDAEGKPVYQGVDTSFLVAILTAAIQEMKAIIDEQSARITALESK